MFPVTVERWRHLVNLEAGRVPPDLVLSVMRRESFGRVGSIGGKDDRYGYTDSELSCGFPTAYRRRDLGLMQVAPLTLRSYNADHAGATITPCQLIGSTDAAAAAQIRVGTWALARALAQAAILSPSLAGRAWPAAAAPPDEQVLLARAIYGFGYSGTRTRLEAAAAAGYPRTFAGLESHHPVPQRLFDGARAILGWYRAGGGETGAPSSPAPSRPIRPPSSSSGGAVIAFVLLAALGYGLTRKRGTA